MLHYIPEHPVGHGAEAGTLGETPTIHPSSVIINTQLGPWTDIGPLCSLEESVFGAYSYTAGDVSIIYAKIGKFCSIASHARINPGNHPMGRVSQHHFTYRRLKYGFGPADEDGFFDWRRSAACTIGNDVWIGHGATVLPGVNISSGAVVGAGAVVTKDVNPFEIVAGVPAKVIRKRFPGDVIEKLLRIEWWEWDRPTLEERFGDFTDLNKFLEKYSEGKKA